VGIDGESNGGVDGVFHALFDEGAEDHALDDEGREVHGINHASGAGKDLFKGSNLVFEEGLKDNGHHRTPLKGRELLLNVSGQERMKGLLLGGAEKLFAGEAELLVKVTGGGPAIHRFEVARDSVDGFFSSNNADVVWRERSGQESVQINERDSSGNSVLGTEFISKDVVDGGNANTVHERWGEHSRKVFGFGERKRRNVEHGPAKLGLRGEEASVLLSNLAKDVDAGLKRGGFDGNVEGGNDVEAADMGSNVLLEEDGGIGSHG
jgi:hypothetical protein